MLPPLSLRSTARKPRVTRTVPSRPQILRKEQEKKKNATATEKKKKRKRKKKAVEVPSPSVPRKLWRQGQEPAYVTSVSVTSSLAPWGEKVALRPRGASSEEYPFLCYTRLNENLCCFFLLQKHRWKSAQRCLRVHPPRTHAHTARTRITRAVEPPTVSVSETSGRQARCADDFVIHPCDEARAHTHTLSLTRAERLFGARHATKSDRQYFPSLRSRHPSFLFPFHFHVFTLSIAYQGAT